MKNLVKSISKIVIIFAAAMMLVACPDKKKDGNVVDRRGGDPGISGGTDGCPQCTETDRLWRALGRTSNGAVEVLLHLYAEDGGFSGGTGRYYTGTVIGFGDMNVDGNIPMGTCNLRDGFYDLTVVDKGYMDASGQIKNMRIKAVGPRTEYFIVNYMSVTSPQTSLRGCDSDDYQQEVIGQWYIEGCGDYVGFVGGPQPSRCY